MRRRTAVVLAGTVLVAVALSDPGTARAAAGDLMDLSLEELAAYQITSVSKKEEELGASAAAAYVITREDMRRSGYTSVAEALRMVPGMHVARENSHEWAIGVRGFNTGLSNKLLVLIDGRSVYSPFFAGVFWELRDVPVEDIERIEVIRGPGATLWGANAVNGVINIITRPADEAQGWTFKAGGGTEEQAFGLLRYGGSAGEDADFRLTASGFQRDDGHRRAAPADGWWLTRLQGRADWAPSEADRLTFTGEVFGAELDQNRGKATVVNPTGRDDAEHSPRIGVNALGRWEHELEDDAGFTAQLWYEYTDIEFTVLRELRHTVDLDLQHHWSPWDRHEVVMGAAYRFSHDEAEERGFSTLDPRTRGIHLVTGFVQDQIDLWPDLAELTLGSKFEHNEFTGFEVQPSGRLAVTPNDWNTLWGSVSRAVRTPTRLENDSDLGLAVLPAGAPSPFDPNVPLPLTTLFVLRGNHRFDSEKLIAYEGGYRLRPHESVSFDVAAFYYDYDELLTAEFAPPVTVPAMGGTPLHQVFPFLLDNELEGHSYGAEVAAWWQVLPWWRLHASYSYIDLHLSTRTGSLDMGSKGQQGSSSRNQVFLRSSFDLPHDVTLDGMLRYADRVRTQDVDAYVELDLRLAWNFCEDWEVAVVGQNLLHDHHAEATGTAATRVERGVYGQLLWRWGGE